MVSKASNPSRILALSSFTFEGSPVIPTASITSLIIITFSQAAALCKSAAPPFAAAKAATSFAAGVIGAKLVGIIIPSACFGHPFNVSAEDDEVKPTIIFGIPFILPNSLRKPQVLKGCEETINKSAPDFLNALA